MANGLYYYKLVSNYSEDITKNCKLTINEIDSNFKNLKDEDIAKAEFDRDSKTLVLTRNNGDKLIVDLSDMTYDLHVDSECTESGETITIAFDGKNGKEELSFKNLVTIDTLNNILGQNVFTHVTHDGTLTGDGTIYNPLGLNGTEKTGVLAPVQALYDLTKGEKLPDTVKLGTRYLTVEYVNDYGYLYNYEGVKRIAAQLQAEGSAWRIPTKEDWDALLDSLEECEFRNHTSAACHVQLGNLAGKYLKSECGWLGEEECECSSTTPISCVSTIDADNDYADDSDESYTPLSKVETTNGVDKYGMAVLPCGYASINTLNQPQAGGYKEKTIFWSSTNVYDDTAQDYYVKEFRHNSNGVWQEAPCPDMYYSVRLVKNYNGANDFSSECIDGITYTTRAFPDSKQVWTTLNYGKKEGFVAYTQGGTTPEIAEVNNGQIRQKRKVMFINEYNGKYWERRQLNEGDTVVIETPCQTESTETTQICWLKDGCQICMDVDIPHVSQYNTEYRVYTTDDCNQELVNTDDSVTERVLETIVPLIYNEQETRKEDYDTLNEKIEQEVADRYKYDEIITKALNAETATRISADTELHNEIVAEYKSRTDKDAELSEMISAETSSRIDADQQLEQAINQERIDRMLADNVLQTQITELSGKSSDEHDAIYQKIEEEKERAVEKEQALDQKVDAETERATAAEADLQAKIDQESSDRTTADDALQASLDDEIRNRQDGDNALQERIAEESMNRQEADAEIYGKLPKAGEAVSFTLSASAAKDADNLTIPSYDTSNAIHVVFDGNFGEI